MKIGHSLAVTAATRIAITVAALAASGTAYAVPGGTLDTLPLREWLAARRELTRLSRPFLATHAAHAQADELNTLLAPAQNAALAQLERLAAEPGNAADRVAGLAPPPDLPEAARPDWTAALRGVRKNLILLDLFAFDRRHEPFYERAAAALKEKEPAP